MSQHAPGPARRAATAAVPPARARVAALLADLAAPGSAVTVAALASRVGGHPNATRAHLDALVDAGHAERAPLPATGRGRPALGYRLTEAGRRALAGDPGAAAYAEIVTAMASHLAQAPDAEALARSIGRTWGSERVTEPSEEALVQVLDDLGFDPEASGEALRLRSCPILDAATEHPEVVCAIHAGLVEGAAGARGVRLLPFAEPGACRIEWA